MRRSTLGSAIVGARVAQGTCSVHRADPRDAVSARTDRRGHGRHRRDTPMTERKPPHKGWDSWIEELIERARTEGAFDDLEGKGKPIPGLDAPYDPDWWVKKLLEREKLSVLPPALEIRAKVERALDEIWQLGREDEVRRRVLAINAEIVRVEPDHGGGSAHQSCARSTSTTVLAGVAPSASRRLTDARSRRARLRTRPPLRGTGPAPPPRASPAGTSRACRWRRRTGTASPSPGAARAT